MTQADAVYSERFDVTTSTLDNEIDDAEAALANVDEILNRLVVKEGQDNIRVLWFYTTL